MKRRILASVLAILLLLVPALAAAEETYSPEALEIANMLNCVVCEGQSVRDSNSALAQQMRDQIQRMLDEGKSRSEILRYFDERYPGILREPPKEGFTLTLWWMPVIGLGLGVLLLVTFLRQQRSRVGRGASTGDPAAANADLRQYEEQVLREIDRLDAKT